MSAQAALFSRSWQVGGRTVTLTVPAVQKGQLGHASIEWFPAPPSKLTAEEWRQYREGRAAAVQALRDETGLQVAVVEL